jgi:hypothetical protein
MGVARGAGVRGQGCGVPPCGARTGRGKRMRRRDAHGAARMLARPCRVPPGRAPAPASRSAGAAAGPAPGPAPSCLRGATAARPGGQHRSRPPGSRRPACAPRPALAPCSCAPGRPAARRPARTRVLLELFQHAGAAGAGRGRGGADADADADADARACDRHATRQAGPQLRVGPERHRAGGLLPAGRQGVGAKQAARQLRLLRHGRCPGAGLCGVPDDLPPFATAGAPRIRLGRAQAQIAARFAALARSAALGTVPVEPRTQLDAPLMRAGRAP